MLLEVGRITLAPGNSALDLTKWGFVLLIDRVHPTFLSAHFIEEAGVQNSTCLEITSWYEEPFGQFQPFRGQDHMLAARTKQLLYMNQAWLLVAFSHLSTFSPSNIKAPTVYWALCWVLRQKWFQHFPQLLCRWRKWSFLKLSKSCLVAGQCGRAERLYTFETYTWILIQASQLGCYVSD